MKLLLFDIDGTLIRSNGAGRLALKLTLEEVFGTAGPIDDYHMSGKTDARIITDLMQAAHIKPEKVQANLQTVYERMAAKAERVYGECGVMPCLGVTELLAAINQRDEFLLGLLTGNARQTAPLKLAAGGIVNTQFRVGAYGSDHMDRNQLPAIAMSQATELTGYSFDGKNTIIIGDTPADILCARAGQATAVAVATGWHAVHTLAQYQPDHLLENLGDTTAVVKILLS